MKRAKQPKPETSLKSSIYVRLPFRCVKQDSDSCVLAIPSQEISSDDIEAFDKIISNVFPLLKQADRDKVFDFASLQNIRNLIGDNLLLTDHQGESTGESLADMMEGSALQSDDDEIDYMEDDESDEWIHLKT